MDCFALSLSDGLAYQDINKKRGLFIAAVFGIMQGLMPMLGYLLGTTFAEFIDSFDHYISFGLLAIIGGKMIYEGIKDTVKPEEAEARNFKVGEVLLQGVADSIDALAVGITLGTAIKATATYQIWVAIGVIAAMSFLISLLGLGLGKWINKLLKGRYHIAEIIGGAILVGLGVYLLLDGLAIFG